MHTSFVGANLSRYLFEHPTWLALDETLQALFLGYLKVRTRRLHENTQPKVVKRLLANFPLTFLTDPCQSIEWLEERASRLSSEWVKKLRGDWREWFQYCITRGGLKVDPDLLDAVEPVRARREGLPECYSSSECEQLIYGSQGVLTPRTSRWRSVHYHLCVLLSLTCGLRREEALGLRWEDVDLERCELRIHPNQERGIKTGNGWRLVPVSDILRRALRMVWPPQVEGRVFPGVWASKRGRRIDQATGVHFTAQQSRRTFMTALASAALPERTICLVMGHGSTDVASQYYWGRRDLTIPELELWRFDDRRYAFGPAA